MPVVVGALVVLGLFAVASRRAPRSARLADPNAGLAAWVSDLYARIGGALPIALPPLEFSAVVPNAASDGRRILVKLGWVRATLMKHCDDPRCAVAAVVGVLVHELVHHAYQDAWVPASNFLERRRRERRADFFAGAAVAALGLEPAHLERVLGDPDFCCSVSYDPPWERALTVREGALHARLRAAA